MKIAVLPESFSKVPLAKVFADAGVPKGSIVSLKALAEIDFAGIDILVLSQDVVMRPCFFSGSKILKIVDFVRRGGVCWVLHQEREGGDFSWLPKELYGRLRIDLRYRPTMICFRGNAPEFYEYLSPWIVQRDHPVWNKPYYLDEADFAEWRVKIGDRYFETTALNAIIRQEGWDVIAGYQDPVVKMESGAALVMEAKYGKGMYFWTQFVSPSLVWKNKNARERVTWEKLIANTLQYCQDFKKGTIARVATEAKPWSVMAGDEVVIGINAPADFKPHKVDIEVTFPGGRKKTTRDYPVAKTGSSREIRYTPEMAGEYRIRVKTESMDRRQAVSNAFFKVTKGVTPYRFTNHHHYQNDWVPSSLAHVYGSAKVWGVDAVFVASGNFYHCDDMLQVITPKIIRQIDNPRTRFFPGQEIHPHHPYGLDEGGGFHSDLRHHATTMGCYTIKPGDWDYWDPDTIREAHRRGGVIFVAHHQRGDKWWLKKYKNQCFDGVSFDHVHLDGDYWDRILKKGKLLPGVRSTDCAPGLYGNTANTAWLREPLSMKALLKACICGRVSFHQITSGLVESKDSYIWLDLGGQMMGGTVYAVDAVNLHIEIKSHLLIKAIRVIKDGDKNFRILKVHGKKLDLNLTDTPGKNIYYRIEAYAKERLSLSDGPEAITNPIFVKKVAGPKGACFYFDKDPDMIFDRREGRFVPNETKVEGVEYRRGIWRIKFTEPEAEGVMRVGGVGIQEARLDKKKACVESVGPEEATVRFGKGKHILEVSVKEG